MDLRHNRYYIILGVTLVILASMTTFISWNSDENNVESQRRLSFQDTFPDRLKTQELVTLIDKVFDSVPNGYTLRLDVDVVQGNISTQAKLITSDSTGEAIILFEGSEDSTDWLGTNSDSWLDIANFSGADSSVKIHSGFSEAVLDHGIAESLENAFLALNLNSVRVSGHSLGAACAHVMGTYLAAKRSDINVQVVTFGQPRVGNDGFKSFSESLSNLSTWRIVHMSEWVSRLPYAWMGYDHAGHTIQIEKKSTKAYYKHVGNEVYEGVPDSWYYGTSILNHDFTNIIKFFAKIAPKKGFWPTSFVLKPEAPKCKWWQVWCWLS